VSEKRPVRVLQVLRRMNRAGIESWLMHLLRRFDRREIAFDFLVQIAEPGAHDAEIRALGARILVCGDPRRRPWIYGRNFLRFLRGYGPYDVIHTHNYFFSGFDLRLAAMARTPMRICHLHPVRDIEGRGPFRAVYRRLMGNWIREYSNVVLAPSFATLDAFRQYADLSAKLRYVVRNCVDLAAYCHAPDKLNTRRRLGLPPDQPVIAYVARFEPHKNHIMAADVSQRLSNLGVRAHFAIAGSDGTARRAFEQRIGDSPDFSVFVDMPDVAPLLQCADLFFFPSREEGFGAVAIEAAAAGLPVVATDLPGIREAVCPGQREYLFEENSSEAAARNIHAILREAALRERLAAEGRKWASQFSIETVSTQMAELYFKRPGELIYPKKDADLGFQVDRA
jgi:glycosyltransferase involved in cell wall biosynthesis